MRTWHAVLEIIAVATLAACSSDPSSPSGDGGGGGTGNGDGGGVAVTVGNILFRSNRNGSQNTAVDTVAAGGSVTWTWVNTGQVPHSVESEGSPGFASSAIMTGGGRSYSIRFTAPGTYRYDCAVHGAQMTGTIVVR